MTVKDALEIFEQSPEQVSRETVKSYHGDDYEVFVFHNASTSNLLGLAYRANFESLVEHFLDEHWEYTVKSESFAVRTDAPDEVLVYMAQAVLVMAEHVILDDYMLFELQRQDLINYIGEITWDIACKFELEEEDINHIVNKFVTENHEHTGVDVFVPNLDELYEMFEPVEEVV